MKNFLSKFEEFAVLLIKVFTLFFMRTIWFLLCFPLSLLCMLIVGFSAVVLKEREMNSLIDAMEKIRQIIFYWEVETK